MRRAVMLVRVIMDMRAFVCAIAMATSMVMGVAGRVAVPVTMPTTGVLVRVVA